MVFMMMDLLNNVNHVTINVLNALMHLHALNVLIQIGIKLPANANLQDF